MRKTFFLILFLLSMQFSYSGEESSGVYIGNLSLLDTKILDTEKAISIYQGKDEEAVNRLEHLKEMLVLVKSKFQVINYSISISDEIKLAKDNGWKNIAKYLMDTAEICKDLESVKDDCFLKVAGIKEFVLGRKISKNDQESFVAFSNNYLNFLETKIEINKNFMENLDFALKETHNYFSFKSLPLITVKINKINNVTPVNHPLIKVINEQEGRDNKVSNKRGERFYLIGIFIFIVFVLLYFYLKKEKHLKKMKQFYSKVYFSGKRNNLELKIFGNIKPHDLVKIKKIELIFTDVLVSSSTFANKAILRFKSNDNELIIETMFEDIGAIQNKLGSIEAEAFSSGLNILQLKVQALGGELFFVNLFNEKGENNCTSYSLLIPTV